MWKFGRNGIFDGILEFVIGLNCDRNFYFYVLDSRQILVYDHRCLGDNLPVRNDGYICV